MKTSPFLRVRPLLATVATLLGFPVLHAPGAALTWTNTTGNWSVPGNWSPAGPPSGDPTDVLTFGGSVLSPYTASNDLPAPLVLNQFNFTATGGDGTKPSQTLVGNPVRLAGSNPQIVATGSGAVSLRLPIQLPPTIAWTGDGIGAITIDGGLSGASDIVKSGTSTFRFGTPVDGQPSQNTWMGNLTINGGVVRFNNNAFSGPTALRANPVTLNGASAGAASLTVQPNAADDPKAGLRVGTLSGTNGTVQARKELSGNDTVNFNSAPILITALTDGSFGGTVRNSAIGNGSVNDATFTVRGVAKQTFTGTTSIAKDVFVGGSATLELAGTASLAAQTSGAIVLASGNFRLDNTATNMGRLRDAGGTGLDTNGGGTFTLVGNSAGSSELLTQLQLGATKARSGEVHVQVQHNAGAAAATTLQFSALKRDNSEFTASPNSALNEFATVDFSAVGGTLGAGGNGPVVKFTTTPTTQGTGGLFKNTEAGAAETTVGWATVNGSSFATYDGTLGVKPVTTVAFPAGSSPTANASLTDSGAIPGAGAFALNSVKIEPGAGGQSLTVADGGYLETTAVMLAGTNDYTITDGGAGTGGLGGNETRYIHVQNAGTTLNLNARVNANNTTRPLVKAGAGTLALGSVANGASTVSTIINEGTVRAEPGVSLPGGELRFRGGVLEITGNSFSRNLGNVNGTVSWSGFNAADNGGLGAGVDEDRGSGGFAAFGPDPTVDAVVDLNAAGPTLITWEDRYFVNSGYALVFGSRTANRRVNLIDNIGLNETSTTANYNAREIRVIDNPGVETDVARLSGTISGGTVQNNNLNDLLKTGDGVLELTGTNTYGGATIVQAGTLLVNGSTSSSFLTDVRTGARLGGNGTVGAVRIGAGGTLAPGVAAGRTSVLNMKDLTFTGSTAKLSIEIGGVTPGGDFGPFGYDQANVTGIVTLNGATLELSALSGFTADPEALFFIVKNDGTDPVAGTFAQGSQVAFGGQTFDISYTANAEGVPSFDGGNDIALRLVPEPSSAALLALGALALAGQRRRARQ